MTITIDASEPRTIRALEIAAGASQWLRCHTTDGTKRFGIPSQRQLGVYHLADQHTCSCQDFQRRSAPCKHVLAIRLHCELVKAGEQQPKRRGRLQVVKPAAESEADVFARL